MAGDYAKKSCPRCGQLLYEDMEVCYGCLYDYRRKDNGPSEIAAALDEPDGLKGDRAATPAVPAPFSPPPAVPATDMSAGAAQAAPACPARGDDEMTTVLDESPGERPAHAVWVRTAVADVLIPLGDEGLNVGRGSGNQIVLHAKSVSRRHLRLVGAEGGVEAIDLGSTNPARYRGVRITGPVLVPWGESVQVGEASLVMQG